MTTAVPDMKQSSLGCADGEPASRAGAAQPDPGSRQCSRGRFLCICTGMAAAGLTMLVLAVAGVAKLNDLPEFQRSLLTWEYLPDWSSDIIQIGLPIVEVLVAVLWAAGVKRRWCERAALALLAAMLGATVVQCVRGATPVCNCLGALTRHLAFVSETQLLMFKSGSLFVMLFVGHFLLLLPPPAVHRTGRADRTGRDAWKPPGFTLIETLVTIAVIATLVSLLAVGIAGFRRHALRAKTLAYLGQHGAVLSLYATDWRDSFPMFADPANPPHAVTGAGETITFNVYFESHTVWHWALMDRYYDGVPIGVFFDAEQTAQRGAGGAPFVLSCSLLASPQFWARETRSAGVSQIVASRYSEVTFPSNKAVLLSLHPFTRDFVPGAFLPDPRGMTAGVPTLAADGHASHRAARTFVPGLGIGEMTPGFSGVFHTLDLFVGLHTNEGVHGRDW